MPDELVDIAGAATILATSERHVRALVRRREIAFVKVGKLVRIRVTDLSEYTARRTIPAEH